MSTERRNLIIVRAGERSLHRTWSEGHPDRSWDLLISSYAPDGALHAEDGDLPMSIDRGTKFDSLHRYLTAHPEVFDRYDYICLPDDDLLMSGPAIDRLFATCREFDLHLAQPSQVWTSYYGHAITLNSPGFRLRFTNFVEAQWPCFRSDYLRALLPVIANRYSGWGIDVVWALLMSDPWQACAVIDEVSMVHTRPHFTGDIYPALARLGVKPKGERAGVLRDYRNPPRLQVVYGAVRLDGRRVGAARTRVVHGAELVRGARGTWKSTRTFIRGMQTLASVATHARYRPDPLVRVAAP